MLKSQSRQLNKINLAFELAASSQGYKRIVGVDEAGRGPLAGPVVAAVCHLKEGVTIEGLNDSKKLSPLVRSALFEEILLKADYGVGIVSHQWIDQINILQATHRAMRLAVQNLSIPPDYILVDGRPVEFDGIVSQNLIKGDARCLSIAAASIIAKVIRDRIMKRYHLLYPEYQYEKHKGYGTIGHRKLLQELGPSPIQRTSFNYNFN